MNMQLKKWFLYGTLLSALGFTISGNDPKLEGAVQLSSNERAPNTLARPSSAATAALDAKAAKARQEAAALVTAKSQTSDAAAAAAAGAETPAAPPTAEKAQTEVPAEGATRSSVVIPDNTQTTERSAPGRTTTDNKQLKFEQYGFYVEKMDIDGKTFNVKLVKGDGSTEAFFYDEAEGKDCQGQCNGVSTRAVFKGETAQNLKDMLGKLEYQIIPKKTAAEKEAAAVVKKKQQDEDEKSGDDKKRKKVAAEKSLENKIDEKCASKTTEKSELECKTKQFIEVLKAEKRAAKRKKGKEDEDDKKPLITDDIALEYFQTNIKDYLKDLLTHKFATEVGQSAYETVLQRQTSYYDKQTALRDKNDATKFIRELLQNLGKEYQDTRKEVASLHREATKEQAEEVMTSLMGMNSARDSGSRLEYINSLLSFNENRNYLSILNQDLFKTISDGSRYANSQGFLSRDYYSDILKDLNLSRNEILRDYITDGKMLNITSSLTGIEGPVTNVARCGRGNLACGSVVGTSSSNGLIRTGNAGATGGINRIGRGN